MCEVCVSACVSVGPGEPALIVGSFLRQGGVGGALGLGAEVGGRWLTEERGCSRHTGRGSQEGNGALRALRNAKGASWRAGVSGVHSRQVGWGQGCLRYSCSSGCGHHDPSRWGQVWVQCSVFLMGLVKPLRGPG